MACFLHGLELAKCFGWYFLRFMICAICVYIVSLYHLSEVKSSHKSGCVQNFKTPEKTGVTFTTGAAVPPFSRKGLFIDRCFGFTNGRWRKDWCIVMLSNFVFVFMVAILEPIKANIVLIRPARAMLSCFPQNFPQWFRWNFCALCANVRFLFWKNAHAEKSLKPLRHKALRAFYRVRIVRFVRFLFWKTHKLKIEETPIYQGLFVNFLCTLC